MQKQFGLILSILLISIYITACGVENEESKNSNENSEVTEQEKKPEDTIEVPKLEEPEEPKEPETITSEITISAIGDMLIHDRVYEEALTSDGYDFSSMLAPVKPFLTKSTISIANQETMIGGVELGLSSYPLFNSPHEVGDGLRDIGIDVVTLANNHTLDRGEEAVQSAIKHWEEIDMMYTGSYKNQEDSQLIRVYHTEEDIDVSFLSYTYGTNGIPVPEGKDYLVNLIDKEKMASDIEEAKDLADVVVLSLHFGNEYERMPSQQQKDLVQFAADQGVHAIIGHHPHVLQPVEWVEGKDGNQTFVAYSLGNFLSGQVDFYRCVGGIVNFTVEKTVKGEEETIKVKSPQFIPTFVERGKEQYYQVTPMYQLTNKDLQNAEEHYQEIKAHMSQWVPELEFIESE
ncbi:CapA family protein [Aquibacillus halophilus]|uniref:CapA family protein n=1 Tax=Aquibacillus halophilus TaxID=930132 RepID=A0A6A8DR37_9BACI|nr:CapA family protein [Aquibacillus halophilus]MRH43662.1 CapA family protein [Aquibacillus halophilus]